MGETILKKISEKAQCQFGSFDSLKWCHYKNIGCGIRHAHGIRNPSEYGTRYVKGFHSDSYAM